LKILTANCLFRDFGAGEAMTTFSDKYMTKSETARYLDKCDRTLDRWRKLKIGPPATMIGRHVFFRRVALEAWLLNKEERPP
jgi:hypothetical protein